MDEAGSDPSSSTLKSSISSSEKAEIDDDTLLAEMMEDVQENKVFTEGVETKKTETEKTVMQRFQRKTRAHRKP